MAWLIPLPAPLWLSSRCVAKDVSLSEYHTAGYERQWEAMSGDGLAGMEAFSITRCSIPLDQIASLVYG